MEINILNPDEIKNDLLTFFKNKSLLPIVGAGLSCGAIQDMERFLMVQLIRNI